MCSMKQSTVLVWMLVQVLLLRESLQDPCPPVTMNLTCSPPGSSCVQDVDLTGHEGKTILLTEPGTYRLTTTVFLSAAVVTCINGSTHDAGSYILESPLPANYHFAMVGTGSTLLLESLTVQGNVAASSGGIIMPAYYIGSLDQLTTHLVLSSVIYQGNAYPIQVYGNGSSLTITDSKFTNNPGIRSPGGAIFAAEDGGDAAITITFNGNNSFDSNSGLLGAICLRNNVLVTQSTAGCLTFSHNQATSLASDDGGGAIYMVQTKMVNQVQMNLSNAVFINNSASTGNGGHGGAIMVLGGRLTLQSTNQSAAFIFTGNTAGSSGGAIYVSPSPYVSLEPGSAMLTVSGAVFNFNQVPGLSVPAGPSDSGTGGAVYAGPNTSVIVASSSFSYNKAHQGGGIAAQGQLVVEGCSFNHHSLLGNGGGILGTMNAVVTVTDCAFDYNTAGRGGAIATDTAKLYVQSVVAGTAFSSNTASDGGALYVNNSLVNMTSTSGAVKLVNNAATASGGAVYAEGSTLFLGDVSTPVDATFVNNNAGAFGGAIACGGNKESVLQINNVVFDTNAARTGGALALLGTTMTIFQATFDNNQANAALNLVQPPAGSGGAIYITQANGIGPIYIGSINRPGHRTTMTNNRATVNGGGMYMEGSGAVTMGAVCFVGNMARVAGGAIYVTNSPVPGLTLIAGLQSFGGNFAGPTQQAGNALYLDTGVNVACVDDPKGFTLNGNGAYNIEGVFCTNLASTPTVNTCPAGAQTCTCPANTAFNTTQCACQEQAPLGPALPPSPSPSPSPSPLKATGLSVSITGLQRPVDVGTVVEAVVAVSALGQNGSVVMNVTLTVTFDQWVTAAGAALPSGCSLGSNSLTCDIGNVTVGLLVYTAALQLTAVQAGTASITAAATGIEVAPAETQAITYVLGACCSTTPGEICSSERSAGSCTILNGTFFSTKNCSTACGQPPKEISLDLLRTARSPKIAEVGRAVRFLMVVTAPNASAVNVTAVLVIPVSLKFLSINPPDCTVKQQTITCQPFHALPQGRTRQFVIATTSLSAGSATISATVSGPGGAEGQSSLTVPILGGCCSSLSSPPCRAATAVDCRKTSGKFYKTKSCKALKKICPVSLAGSRHPAVP